MDKLRDYLLSQLSILFFSIFLPLFAIASLIYLIKLAAMTSVIQLSIGDMVQLYLFFIPDLLFYTLPIAFIVSASLALYRLSMDNEMVVVFSLGISPLRIGRIIAKPALLLTFILFVDYLLVSPYVKIISKNFLEQKKAEAKFNLTASEFGHKFGDWMLFINKSDPDKRSFENVVLYNKSMKDEILISATKAELINEKGALRFRLEDGQSFSYDNNTFKEMHFKTIYINDVLDSNPLYFRNPIDFWTNDERRDSKNQMLTSNTLFSLFPTLSLFLILSLGILHARHQKRWIYLWLFLAIVAFYAATTALQKSIGFHAIWVITAAWLAVTIPLYQRVVGRRF